MNNTLSNFASLKYDIERSMGYHNMRAGFFQRSHSRAMIAVVIALATPLAGVANIIAQTLTWCVSLIIDGAAISEANVLALLAFCGIIAAIVDIYYRPAQMAGMHSAAEVAYKQISNELEVRGISEDEIASLRNRYELVDSRFEERHVIVNIVSHNRVARVSGLKQKKILWPLRFMMHWFTFASYDLKTK